MVDLFVQDLTEGIAGRGVKAALLGKCAVEGDLTPASSGSRGWWPRPTNAPERRSPSTPIPGGGPVWWRSG